VGATLFGATLFGATLFQATGSAAMLTWLDGFLPSFLTTLDVLAVAYFLAAWILYNVVSGSKGYVARSLTGAVQQQRVQWMRNMVRRDNRVLDQVLLTSLSQGSAFFASTSAIAIGGLAAMMGSGDKVQVIMERLPYAAQSSGALFDAKLLLIMVIFVYAFFKFAWAFRLSHYTAIMIGATPILSGQKGQDAFGSNSPIPDAAGSNAGGPDAVSPDAGQLAACDEHAQLTARIAGLSAEHSNGGVRAFYYAIAGAAWFYHPLALVAATTWVLVILIRRDFFSRSRSLLAAAGGIAHR
jgi:uncharacterized membrane protein